MRRQLRRLLDQIEGNREAEIAAELALEGIARGLERAAARYREFHWGDSATETIDAKIPDIRAGDSLFVLGELVRLDYTTHKDGEEATWWHAFQAPRPLLASTCTSQPRLCIVGGGYKIREQGIVG